MLYGLLRGLDCPLALTALGMDWTEDDTTVNDISNIIFIERRHACRTELLKNGDGRTDGRTDAPSLRLAPLVGDRPGGEAASFTLHDGD